ncbi:hypothetical protein, partial [Komagataeibacter sp. SM21]|uniref:hypothetical protein n=1 Tax=Komagataeibacter sp. SM21 TaxID=3242899 RepID=UPI003528049A
NGGCSTAGTACRTSSAGLSSATAYATFKLPPDQASPTFAHTSTDFDIEHFVLFDGVLFDDADLDAEDHAKRLACRSLVISGAIDGNVIIGFATKQSMEDFIDWGNDAIRAHCPKSLNHTGPTLEERA